MRWPDDLITTVDQLAVEKGSTRSGLVRKAVWEMLKREQRCGHEELIEVAAGVFCNACGEPVDPATVTR